MSAKFLTLKLITDEIQNRREPDEEPGVEVGEDDGLVPQAQSADATSGRHPQDGDIRWKPMTLSVDAIRNFYPREGGRPGTRILLKSGVKYIVLNETAEINAAIGDVADLTA